MKISGLTRREMMVRSARAVAGLALTTACRSSHALQDDPPNRGFKIGVCDWSIGRTSNPSALELAKELGLDGVQVSLGTVPNDMHLRNPDIQKAFLEAAKKHDMEIASLAIGALNSVPYKSDPRAEQWVADSIDVCTALGLKVVLLAFFDRGDLRDDDAGIETVVDRLKRVAPKAEQAGVILGLETWLSAEQHMDIIDRVGSSAVQVYYDVGNSHLRGYDIYEEIRSLGIEHICEFHAKDYNNLFGQGKVDFKEVRRAMDDIGYRGWIQIEGAKPLGLKESYLHDAQYLRSVFPPTV